MSMIIEIIQGAAPVRWLATPAGLALAVGMLGFVLSGLAGRMVLFVAASSGGRGMGWERDRGSAAPAREN